MKMQITYKPEAAEPREWVVDRGNPSWDISYVTEKATDWGWVEFLERLDGISPRAWQALLWALRKRDEPRLRLEWVEIDDWSEIEYRIQCPGCDEWLLVQEGELHECASPASETDESAAEVEPPAKSGKKKAGDPRPEA